MYRAAVMLAAILLLSETPLFPQSRDLTVAVLVNAQNASGYNPDPLNPGEFQRFAERYLQHLQIPYEVIDISAAAPSQLSSRQLIVAGHSRLSLTTTWRTSIAQAVGAGTGFVNLDADSTIGNESHIATIFGATGSVIGAAASQIVIPSAVAPGGATPHYIAGLQKIYGDTAGGLNYSFHAAADGSTRTAASTILQNATGIVIARLGNDPLILATPYGSGRAVHFGTLEYLRADRFGFLMGLDDLFWRSLVWAARKPFVIRAYPRFWSVQMDDQWADWGTRVRDMYDPARTGQKATDGTGGPWKVTGYVFTDNLAPGSTDRINVIADINAGKLEISPHSFADIARGNLYWNPSTGPLTDDQWLSNMALLDSWRQGNGAGDAIPSLSRSLIGHFWHLSNNTGHDLWNRYGIRYITSIIKPGYLATGQYNGAERLKVRPFWLYDLPPKTSVSPSYTTENYPLFFTDDYQVGSRAGLAAQTFFLFTTQYTDYPRWGRVDFAWPRAWPTAQTVATSVAQLQQYTWRFWSSLAPVQLFTHDALNYDSSTTAERQSVITQASAWLNTNGVRHAFMDDLGDYLYARNKSSLTRATFDGSQLAYTFTGATANPDGQLIQTELLVFQSDDEGAWQPIPGFTSGTQIVRNLPPSIQSIAPATGSTSGGTTVMISGTSFTPGATVYFGPTAASTVTYVNSSTLEAIAPAASAGVVDVRVMTASGHATLPSGFTYVIPPPVCPCSIWPSSATPGTIDVNDPAAVQVGVKFRSDFAGYITGLRFYKSAANTGTHVANLWTTNGTLMATATFVSESASGWQEVAFPSAVAITAGTTYVASYFAPNGHYSRNLNFFSSAGVDTGPLHFLRDGVDGGNGVYGYGTSSTFPTSTYQAANYWVDVVFNTSPTIGLTITAVSPTSGATGVSVATTVGATFNQAVNPATVTPSTFRLLDSTNNPVAATVTYDSASRTATLTPSSGLAASAGYRAIVVGGSAGVKDNSGNGLSADVSWTFTTGVPPRVCPCTVWNPTEIPAIADSGDAASVEVGVRFRSDIDGYITGLRFYKSAGNTGAHVANLWTNTGTLLASAPFVAETASGWQHVTFSSAVFITAGVTYVASYFAPNGHYSRTLNQWASAGLDNAPLHILRSGLDGSNGVYSYGTSSRFPTSTFQAANYWVDVVFNTSSTVGLTVTSVTPASGATGVSVTASVNSTFSQQLDASTVDSNTFRLLDSTNSPIAGSVTYDSQTATASFRPTSALAPQSSYTAVIRGGSTGVKDTSGSPMAADVAWSFVTDQALPSCPCSIWSTSTTPAIVDAGDTKGVELGVKFRTDVDGYITGLRFYKSSANTGSHLATLWTIGGAMLATATFTNETASGWQEVNFPSPPRVTAGVTYIASYYAPNGRYARTVGGFSSTGVDNSPLHALRNGVAGSNGVFTYAATSSFPSSSFQSSNYWVDVVFNTTPTPPAVSSLTLTPSAVLNGTGATGKVTLSGVAPPGGALVTLGSDNPGAAAVPGSVTIASGATTAEFEITTSSIAAPTPVTISASYNGLKSAVLSVENTLRISAVDVSPQVIIGGNSGTGAVTLNGPAPSGGVAVALTSDNAAATVPSSVTIAAGTRTGTFIVTTNVVESPAPVTITASYGGAVRTVALTVDDTVSILSLTINPTSVVAGQNANGVATLTGPAPEGGAVVELSSDNTNAASVPTSITILEGAITGNFTVTTSAVAASTPVTISAVYNRTATATLTVENVSVSSVSLSPISVVGGVNATGTVILTAVAPAGGVTVALSSTDSSVAAVPATITVAAGASSATFAVTTVGVSSTSTTAISATSGGVTKSSNLTVTPASLASVTLNPTTVAGGASSTATISLNGLAPPDGATVSLLTTNTAATVAATVAIAAGQKTAIVTVSTSPVSEATTGTVSATYRGTTVSSAVLRVNPPTLNTVSLSPRSIVGGGTSTGSLALSGAAPAGTVITLSTSNTAASVPSEVTVPAGATTVTFTVSTTPVAAAVSGTISGTYRNVTRTSATLTVNPPALGTLVLDPATVTGGSQSTGTVTLTGVAAAAVTVALSVSSTAASVPASVTVPAGSDNATFTINTFPVLSNANITVFSSHNGVKRNAILSVRAPIVQAIALNPSTVSRGTPSIGTVTLDGVAPTTGISVSLSSSNTSVATTPTSVVVPSGSANATFNVTTVGVGTATISATRGVTKSTGLTVTQ